MAIISSIGNFMTLLKKFLNKIYDSINFLGQKEWECTAKKCTAEQFNKLIVYMKNDLKQLYAMLQNEMKELKGPQT
jgi:hypothetical protein